MLSLGSLRPKISTAKRCAKQIETAWQNDCQKQVMRKAGDQQGTPVIKSQLSGRKQEVFRDVNFSDICVLRKYTPLGMLHIFRKYAPWISLEPAKSRPPVGKRALVLVSRETTNGISVETLKTQQQATTKRTLAFQKTSFPRIGGFGLIWIG